MSMPAAVKMMKSAAEALKGLDAQPLLIAVTVLTMDEDDLKELGISKTINVPVEDLLRLAKLTHQAGLDGVVCSAQEAKMLKRRIAVTTLNL